MKKGSKERKGKLRNKKINERKKENIQTSKRCQAAGRIKCANAKSAGVSAVHCIVLDLNLFYCSTKHYNSEEPTSTSFRQESEEKQTGSQNKNRQEAETERVKPGSENRMVSGSRFLNRATAMRAGQYTHSSTSSSSAINAVKSRCACTHMGISTSPRRGCSSAPSASNAAVVGLDWIIRTNERKTTLMKKAKKRIRFDEWKKKEGRRRKGGNSEDRDPEQQKKKNEGKHTSYRNARKRNIRSQRSERIFRRKMQHTRKRMVHQ